MKSVKSANEFHALKKEPNDLKKDAWKKIKWGLIISIIGFAAIAAAVNLGVFTGYSNTDDAYLEIAKLFSMITLLPMAFVLGGLVELATGVPILKIIEKWEDLPQWLSWLIGAAVFFLILLVILGAAAVIIFNFF